MEQTKSRDEKFTFRDWNLMLIAILFGILGNMIVELFFQAVGTNHLAPLPSWVSLILVLSFTIIGFKVILPPRIRAGIERGQGESYRRIECNGVRDASVYR